MLHQLKWYVSEWIFKKSKNESSGRTSVFKVNFKDAWITWRESVYNAFLVDAEPNLNINKIFIWPGECHTNLLCTFCLDMNASCTFCLDFTSAELLIWTSLT